MDKPLEIRLSAPKPKTLAGEEIVLDVEHRVFADLEMQPVTLNDRDTTISITPLGDGAGPEFELTGQDHRLLHHLPTFVPVGSSFSAPAGSAWTGKLNLLLYTYPLRAGRYRVRLTYRYGESEEQVLETNPVEIEVTPTGLAAVQDRWFGGSDPRYQLGSLWATPEGRWFYQLANRQDPCALASAVDLHVPTLHVDSPPSLAHLNDLSDAQFDRWAVWTEAGRLGWVKLAYIGRTGEPVAVEHGLAADPAPLLAEPPLQRRSGGFCAVLTGHDPAGKAAATLIAVDGEGNVDQRPVALPGAAPDYAVVAWPESDDVAEAVLYTAAAGDGQVLRTPLAGSGRHEILEVPGKLTALVVDQWNGTGSVLAVALRDEVLRIVAWDFSSPAGKGDIRSTYDIKRFPPAADRVIDVVALARGRDLALLMTGENCWMVLSEGRVFRVRGAAGAAGSPRLVAGPKSLFLVEHVPERGFVCTRVGEPPPPAGI